MTTLPANGATGTVSTARNGIDTTTTSPASAASAAVAARARSPISDTRSASVSGPRELLMTTSWPCSAKSLARVPPMLPLPMNPMVVMRGERRTPPACSSGPSPRAGFEVLQEVAVQVLAGLAAHDRVVDAGGAVDQVERRVPALGRDPQLLLVRALV